tara:strand:- start:142970 stop:144991 length:2022 start_codon:yes stop_codon:yes gene_type:complete
MCGIAGIIKIHDPKDGTPPHPLEAIPETWLDILDESIKHRGPDGQGRFRDRATRDDGTIVDVALVHRRLSIIDHKGGTQPMVHDGDRLRPDLTYQPGDTPIIASDIESDKPLVAVVFNGCIYNHRELRTELEAAGHEFETDHSDTEVLVHGWREFNIKLGEQLDAMSAYTVWDQLLGTLALGRDLAHEKPLFFMNNSLQEIFHSFSSVASGLAKLVHAAGQYASPTSPDWIGDWIRFGTSNDPAMPAWSWPYRGMTHTIEEYLDHQSNQQVRMTELPGGSRTRSPLSEEVDEILTSAVLSRLEADVELGCFLSGGIDSALVSSIAFKELGKLKTFCVRMPSSGFDESTAAIETANIIGTDHTTLDCDLSPASDLVDLIEQIGLPFGDSSLLPTYWVSKAVRSITKVALSGDGGDELFSGYARYVAATSPFSPWARFIPYCLLPDRKPSSKLSQLRRLSSAARYNYAELISIFNRSDLLRLSDEFSFSWLNGDQVGRECDPAEYDFFFYLSEDLLRKVDSASMASALEVRCPFLEPSLIELGLSTRYDILMPNGERKGLLKQVARKYLPDHIVDRPKQGFAIPIGEWFRTDYGDMRQLLFDHLESTNPFPGLAEAGIDINMKFVQQMLREHDAAGEKSINPWHGRDHSQRLYMMLVLSIWSKWLNRIRTESEAG